MCAFFDALQESPLPERDEGEHVTEGENATDDGEFKTLETVADEIWNETVTCYLISRWEAESGHHFDCPTSLIVNVQEDEDVTRSDVEDDEQEEELGEGEEELNEDVRSGANGKLSCRGFGTREVCHLIKSGSEFLDRRVVVQVADGALIES